MEQNNSYSIVTVLRRARQRKQDKSEGYFMKRSTMELLGLLVIVGLTLAQPARAAVALTGSWQVVEVSGKPVTDCQPNREPHLVFTAEGRVSGSTGCNRFTGTYQQDGTSLKFSPFAVTKMACPPPLDALERSFLQAMAATAAMRQSGTTLELLDAGGNVQMRLQGR
jgi:heat shock protein HslJ